MTCQMALDTYGYLQTKITVFKEFFLIHGFIKTHLDTMLTDTVSASYTLKSQLNQKLKKSRSVFPHTGSHILCMSEDRPLLLLVTR
jgi:hypothetical protein